MNKTKAKKKIKYKRIKKAKKTKYKKKRLKKSVLLLCLVKSPV